MVKWTLIEQIWVSERDHTVVIIREVANDGAGWAVAPPIFWMAVGGNSDIILWSALKSHTTLIIFSAKIPS